MQVLVLHQSIQATRKNLLVKAYTDRTRFRNAMQFFNFQKQIKPPYCMLEMHTICSSPAEDWEK